MYFVVVLFVASSIKGSSSSNSGGAGDTQVHQTRVTSPASLSGDSLNDSQGRVSLSSSAVTGGAGKTGQCFSLTTEGNLIADGNPVCCRNCGILLL